MLLLTLNMILLYNPSTIKIQDNHTIVNTQDNCTIQLCYC